MVPEGLGAMEGKKKQTNGQMKQESADEGVP